MYPLMFLDYGPIDASYPLMFLDYGLWRVELCDATYSCFGGIVLMDGSESRTPNHLYNQEHLAYRIEGGFRGHLLREATPYSDAQS
jgi:hypothetical protein